MAAAPSAPSLHQLARDLDLPAEDDVLRTKLGTFVSLVAGAAGLSSPIALLTAEADLRDQLKIGRTAATTQAATASSEPRRVLYSTDALYTTAPTTTTPAASSLAAPAVDLRLLPDAGLKYHTVNLLHKNKLTMGQVLNDSTLQMYFVRCVGWRLTRNDAHYGASITQTEKMIARYVRASRS